MHSTHQLKETKTLNTWLKSWLSVEKQEGSDGLSFAHQYLESSCLCSNLRSTSMGYTSIQSCILYLVFPQQLLISSDKSSSKKTIGFKNKSKRNMKRTFSFWEKRFSIQYQTTSPLQDRQYLHTEYPDYSNNQKSDFAIIKREDHLHDPCSEFMTKMFTTKTINFTLCERETQMTTTMHWNHQENN